MAGDDTQSGRDHLLQDVLPLWAKLILLVLFIVVLVPIGILTALFGPSVNESLVDNHPAIDPADFFSGKESLVVSSQDLAFGGLRHRLWIALTLQNRLAQQTSILKEDAQFAIKIYDKSNVTWADTTITRPLSCPQKSVAPDEPGCEPILLAHFPVVSTASPVPFTTEIRALNLGSIADSGLLENFTSVEWEYSSEFHTIAHIIFHYAFFIVTLALLFGFLVAHIIHMWKNRTTAPRLTVLNFEPIWILGLLFFLALFNNPLYIGTFVLGSNSFIFEILNSMFALVFGHILLLFLLLMLHVSMRNPSAHPLNSKEFWIDELIFSGPKFLIVLATLIPRILFFLYFRFLQHQDPTFVGHHNILLNILRIWGDVAFLVLLISGFYWTLCSFVNAPKLLKADSSRGYIATRFFLFFKFTLVLFLAIFVDFVVLMIADSPFLRSFGPELFHAVNFDASINGFSFWAMNMWVVFVAFLHLPADVFSSTFARILLAINDKDPLNKVPFIRGLIVTTSTSAYADEEPFSFGKKDDNMFGGTRTETAASANRDQPVFSPNSSSPDGYKIHYDDDDADAGHTTDQTNVVAQTEEEPSQVSYNYGGSSTTTGFDTANTTLGATSAFASNDTDPNQSWGQYNPPDPAPDNREYSSF